jgi:hypothetical protein
MTPEGHPFWQKLPCEPIDAYTAFQGYLEQGTTGGRQLFVLSNNLNLQQRIAAIRCPQSLNHHHNHPHNNNHPDHQTTGPLEGSGFIPTSTFNQAKQDILHGASHDEFVEWFYLYHWDWRARSHDMFYLDSIKKSRDMMALQLENTHFSDAHALYGKLLAFMNPDPSNPNFKPYFLDGEGEPLFWKGLTPKTALEALKLTTQLQRISIGLHPTSTQHNSNSQRALASTPRSGDSTGSQNIAYLSSPSKRAEASTVSAKTEPTSEQPHDNQTLSASDRARRLAILLDKARSRKAG